MNVFETVKSAVTTRQAAEMQLILFQDYMDYQAGKPP